MYQHCPAPSGLHLKLLSEHRDAAAARYSVDIDHSGRPGYVNVFHCEIRVWHGHRDVMPAKYRGARDPFGALSHPDSSD